MFLLQWRLCGIYGLTDTAKLKRKGKENLFHCDLRLKMSFFVSLKE